jgi:hypothetical protein
MPDPELRCARTGLYVSQCAHCRDITARPPRFLEAQSTEDDEVYVAQAFSAQWPGLCDVCGDEFGPGAWISRMSDTTYRCTECT